MLRIASFVAVGSIVAHAWWGWSAERGLDGDVAALAAAGERVYPIDVDEPRVPDERNAAVDVREAAKLLKDSSFEWMTFQQMDTGGVLRGPKEMASGGAGFLKADYARAIAAVVASNRDVLARLDAAAGKSAAYWPREPGEPLLHAGRVEVGQVAQLAQLLRAAGLLAHHEGDDVACVRRVGQILSLSRIVDRQSSLAANAVGSAVASLAAKTAAEVAADLRLPPLAPPVVRELVDRLLDPGPMAEGRARAMRFSRVMVWDTAKQIAGGRADLLRAADDRPSIRGGRIGCYAAKPLLMEDGRIMLRYATAMIGASGKASNWPAFEAAAPADPPEVFESPRLHFLAAVLIPDFRWYVRGNFRAQTACRLAAVSLAAGAYARANGGAMPGTLDELVPAYLPYVPYDPMAAGGKPVKLGSGSGGAVVYSVGDDGLDDNGSTAGVGDPAAAVRTWGAWDRRDFVVQLTRGR